MARTPAPPPRQPSKPIVVVKQQPVPILMLQSDVSADLSSSSLSNYNGLTLTEGNDIIGKGNSRPTNYLEANNGNSTLIAGTSLSTTLVAGAGNNFLDGRSNPSSGTLLIRGGSGNATMLGGAGRATMQGGTSNNLIIAGSGDQLLVGGQSTTSRNTIQGGIGKDTLQAGKGFSTLVSGSLRNGSNTLVSDGISSSLVAGAGNDSLSAARFGGNVTLVGGRGKTWLVGGKDPNSLVSGSSLPAESNTLLGGSGSNTLVAGGGKDLLRGGDSKNLFLFGKNNILDQSIYLSKKSPSENILGVRSASDIRILDSDLGGIRNLSSGATLDGISNYGSGALSIELGENAAALKVQSINGGFANDTLSARFSNLSLTINGGNGSDSMIGGSGNNYFIVDNAGDSVIEALGGGGVDTIQSFVNYTLSNNTEFLVLGGRDSINGWGNSLDNTLIGNDAQNSILGGDGNDSIIGYNPNVLPDISFVERNVSQVAQGYITSDSNALVNGLGGASGYGTNVLVPNDDGSSSGIDIRSVFGANGLNFYGNQITQIYINNNGNITFNSPASTFTPTSISAGSGIPIIAPFWADVDTRGATGNVSPGGTSDGANRVFWNIDADNRVMTITWDDVGFFSRSSTKVNAFQLQLIDSGNGDGFIVFRYEAVNWTTGSASGGANGLGGNVARAGFNTGTGTVIELPQSGNQSAMLGLPQTTPTVGLNSNAPGVFVFEVRNGKLSLDVAGDYLSGGAGNDTVVASVDSDTIDAGAGNDLLIINASNIGDVDGGANTDTVRILGDVAVLDNVSLPGVEIYDLSQLTAQAEVTLGGNSGELQSLIGSAGNDSITAFSAVGATLNAAAGNDMIAFTQASLVGANTSIIGGSGVDTLSFTNTSSLDGSFFGRVSSIEVFEQNGTGNYAALGANAQVAGIRTIITGEGNDTLDASGYTTGFTLDASRITGLDGNGSTITGGGAADLILFSDHNVLAFSKVVGGAGNDTIAFSENGISITDGNFGILDNIFQVEALRTKDGTNYIQVGAQAAASGLVSIIGGAGEDTVDISAFDAVSNVIDSGNGDDYITGSDFSRNRIVAGDGNDIVNLKDAVAVARSTVNGGAGTDILALTSATQLADSQLGGLSGIEVIRAAASGASKFILGTTAQQIVGIRSAFGGGGNDTLDASGYTAGMTLNGGAGDDSLIVATGDRIRAGKIDGGSGNDTLAFRVDALSVTDADFVNVDNVEALRTANGNNRIVLGVNAQAAGITTLIGGTGRDTLDASATTRGVVFLNPGAIDSLVGGGGVDTIRVSSSFNMSLSSGIEFLQLTGSSPSTLTGNNQDNTISGSTGTDTLIGLRGDDTYIVDSTGDTIIDTAGNDGVRSSVSFDLSDSKVAGGTGIENLVYTGVANAILTGNAANNSITGASGDDVINGLGGTDTLIGQAGDDSYIVDSTGDTIIDIAGNDGVRSSVSFDLSDSKVAGGTGIENLVYTGVANAILTGNAANNSITGGAGNDTLEGKGGIDTLIGQDGDDTYIVDATNDTIIDTAGTADAVRSSVSFDLSNSKVAGGTGIENLVYTGITGATLTGNSANNTITGGVGNDTLEGKGGIDTLIGQGGDDTYIVDSTGDTIIDTSGTADVVRSSVSFDLSDSKVAGGIGIENLVFTNNSRGAALTGNSADNSITGNDGGDTIYGGGGNDYLSGGLPDFGGNGADYLVGGEGDDTLCGMDLASFWGSFFKSNDTLTGDGGADCFILGDKAYNGYSDSAVALITDFQGGTDYLQLKDYGRGAAGYLVAANAGTGYTHQLFDTHAGGNVLIANINYSGSDATGDLLGSKAIFS